MTGRIFISYRRDDARGDARSIHDRLARKFGDSNVFMDVDSLMAGQRFDRQLDVALAQCDVLLAVIGPRWTEALAEKARGDERDFVKDEIAAALKRDIAVIPVLVGQEERMPQMPRAADLPEDIRDLAMYQKHSITHESFSRNIDDLIESIEKVRRAKQRPRAVKPLLAVGLATGVVVAALLVVFRGDVADWFTRLGAQPAVPEARKEPGSPPKNEAGAAKADLSPSEIASRYGKSVVSVQFRWQLYDRASGHAVYHKAWPAMLDGKRVRLPAFVRDGDRAVPWLTTDDDDKQNFPVGGTGAGSGFVASAEGFILTTRTIGAAWSDGIQPSNYLQDGRAFVLDLEGGALKARAVTLQSLNQTRVVSASGQAKLFPDRPAGDAMPVGTPAELFGKNDELIVRFANSDADVSAEFVRYARDQNVALLKVAAPALTPAVLAPDDNITIGARVVALGYSGAVHGPMLADGLVRSIPVDSTDPRQSNIQTSIQVGYGTSGGPVFDPQGRVIGIINFLARDGGQLMTYALPIRHGRTLLNPQSAR